MSNIQISKDADYLICSIYKRYLELRNSGTSKLEAKNLETPREIQALVSNWLLDDVNDTCLELSDKKLLNKKCKYINDKYYRFELSDNGIVYMENRFKNGLVEITDFIAKFIP